jgi:asparagine synthase (glutamine-hydrolysing)
MTITQRATGRIRSYVEQRGLSALSRRVLAERLTYLSVEKLRSLEACARDIDRDGVAGDVMEAGVALGGSAIVLAGSLAPDRHFHGYDLFGQIPPPSERDDARSHERYAVIAGGASQGLGGDTYYGYLSDLYERVVASFERFGLDVDGERVALHQGLFEDTLHPEAPVALAHIDSDWYEPVALCLNRLEPVLSPGALIVLDDYLDYGGCAGATREFLAAHPDFAVVRESGHLVLRRTTAEEG